MRALRDLGAYRDLFFVLASALAALLLLRRPTGGARAPHPEDAPVEMAAPAVGHGAVGAGAEDVVASSRAEPAGPSATVRTPRRSERILALGDSMVEVLAPSLNAYAIANGHELVPAIWYGSTTTAWSQSPELPRLLREVDPTLVIVVLGSSELTARDAAGRRPFVREIVRRVGARRLAWIGPPNWRADTGINDVLSSELGEARFFRSEGLALTRKRDGIHPDAAGARAWMDAFAAWASSDGALALSMEEPTRTAKAPPARVLGRM